MKLFWPAVRKTFALADVSAVVSWVGNKMKEAEGRPKCEEVVSLVPPCIKKENLAVIAR
jgi:hypothetical protein